MGRNSSFGNRKNGHFSLLSIQKKKKRSQFSVAVLREVKSAGSQPMDERPEKAERTGGDGA